jgi:uncharacterized phage protein (TIGR02218 family)
MKTISSNFQNHLDSGCLTVCYLLKITKNNNSFIGFSNHDKALDFEGVSYGGSMNFGDNFTIDSDLLNYDDIKNGDYNRAKVEVLLINWSDLSMGKVVVFSGYISSWSLDGDKKYLANVEPLSAKLNQGFLASYSSLCRAEFGDSKCGVAAAVFLATIVNVNGNILTVSGLTQAASFFDCGMAGGHEVRRHLALDKLELTKTPNSLNIGDIISVKQGCDKTVLSCKKYGNIVNFRGEPYIPSNLV